MSFDGRKFDGETDLMNYYFMYGDSNLDAVEKMELDRILSLQEHFENFDLDGRFHEDPAVIEARKKARENYKYNHAFFAFFYFLTILAILSRVILLGYTFFSLDQTLFSFRILGQIALLFIGYVMFRFNKSFYSMYETETVPIWMILLVLVVNSGYFFMLITNILDFASKNIF